MTPTTDTQRAAALLEAGWPEVLDRLLQGVGHDLNNRVQTLLSLVQLLQLDEEVTSLTPFLEKEVGQLEEVVTLLRLIPAEPGEEDEPIHLPEVVPHLVALHRIQKHLESVDRSLDMDGNGLMPVRAPWSYLGRCVLVFLAVAAWEALARDREVRVGVRAVDGDAVLEAELPGPRIRVERPVPSGRREGLQGVVALLGGTFEATEEDECLSLRIRLPTMGRKG